MREGERKGEKRGRELFGGRGMVLKRGNFQIQG